MVVNISSQSADPLIIKMTVFRNPQILASNGDNILSATTIKEAVEAFISNLPFNGIFTRSALMDAIQAIDGVEAVYIDELKVRRGSEVPIMEVDRPISGYYQIENEEDFVCTVTTINETVSKQ